MNPDTGPRPNPATCTFMRHDRVVQKPDDLNDDENWNGGFYELALELGLRDDALLQAALNSVWTSAKVDGCSRTTAWNPRRHEAVPCTVASLMEHGHLQGVVQLPQGQRLVCGVVAIREEDSRIDWLDFYLPLGALAMTDARIGGYPAGDDGGPQSLAWRKPIDAWLAGIGRHVYAHARFRLGLIGFEVSGAHYAEQLGGAPPEERYSAFLIPNGGLRLFEANR